MKTRQFAQLSYTSGAASFYVNGTEFTDMYTAEGEEPLAKWIVSYSVNDGLGHTSVSLHSLASAVEFADTVIDKMIVRMAHLRGLE